MSRTRTFTILQRNSVHCNVPFQHPCLLRLSCFLVWYGKVVSTVATRILFITLNRACHTSSSVRDIVVFQSKLHSVENCTQIFQILWSRQHGVAMSEKKPRSKMFKLVDYAGCFSILIEKPSLWHSASMSCWIVRFQCGLALVKLNNNACFSVVICLSPPHLVSFFN